MSSDEAFVAELLGLLAKVKLEAIIVGATAAAMQGAPVTTRDVDLLVRDTPRNRTKIKRLCELLRAHPVDSGLAHVQALVGAAAPVDLIFDHLPGALSFESVRSRSLTIAVGKQVARVAELGDIIASKRAAGRPKDRAQLPILEETQRVRQAMKAR